MNCISCDKAISDDLFSEKAFKCCGINFCENCYKSHIGLCPKKYECNICKELKKNTIYNRKTDQIICWDCFEKLGLDKEFDKFLKKCIKIVVKTYENKEPE